MVSKIDPAIPHEGYAYTANVRQNFLSAYNEITALQSSVSGIIGSGNAASPIKVIGYLLGYDFSVAGTDTPLPISISGGAPYVITHLFIVNQSGVAPVPNFPEVDVYTGPLQGGRKVGSFTPGSFSDTDSILIMAVSAGSVDQHVVTTGTLYLNVATPGTAPAIADVYALGFPLGAPGSGGGGDGGVGSIAGGTGDVQINNNGALGVATTSVVPQINLNTVPLPIAPLSPTALWIVGPDSTDAGGSIMLDAFSQAGGGPLINFRSARGTSHIPSSSMNGDVLAGIIGYGYGSSGYISNPGAAIQLETAENWGASNGGALAVYTSGTAASGNTGYLRRLYIASGVAIIGTGAGVPADPGAGNLAVPGSIYIGTSGSLYIDDDGTGKLNINGLALATTPPVGDSSKLLATTQFVASAISGLQSDVSLLKSQMAQLKARQQAANSVTVNSPPTTMSPDLVVAGIDVPWHLPSDTPVPNSRGIITAEGSLGNNSAGQTTNVQLVYGTGPPPAAGMLVTAANGTLVGAPISYTSVTANDSSAFSVSALLTGLLPGTAYWVDVAYSCGGGVAQLSEITVTAFELLDPVTP